MESSFSQVATQSIADIELTSVRLEMEYQFARNDVVCTI